MPAHYEMLVSHSPPVFSHSPPTGFLSDYNTNYNRLYDSPRAGLCRPLLLTQQQQQRRKPLTLNMSMNMNMNMSNINKIQLSPKRSCLVVRPTGTTTTPTFVATESISSKLHNRSKKKVVFADDQGHSLTQIRVMSEPSHMPPLWSLTFLAHLTQGLISPLPPDQWAIAFQQPASNYLAFRRRLDDKNVSLENVIVKENDSIMVGTAKVRNLGFHKEVIVRVTWDSWKSQQDIFCTYSQIAGTNTTYALYDTFSFKLTLPPLSRKLEFCVCFRCEDEEYWDNNDGKNYVLVKRITSFSNNDLQMTLDAETNATINNNNKTINKPNVPSSPIEIPRNCSEMATNGGKLKSWSEFASWNHLEANNNNSPYW